jgi:hypothetical protein
VTSRSPYTIEISPAAWSQLGALPRGAYLRIQSTLHEAALRSITGAPAVEGRNTVLESGFSFDSEEYAARYDVDPETRRIILREVVRRPMSAE